MLDDLKKMMRPEFLNRIDKVIVFRALTRRDIYRIIDLQMDELNKRLQKKGMAVRLTPATKQFLLEKGYDAKNGVRPLRRLIQDTVEDHIATELLNENYQKGDIITIGAKKDELIYSTLSE